MTYFSEADRADLENAKKRMGHRSDEMAEDLVEAVGDDVLDIYKRLLQGPFPKEREAVDKLMAEFGAKICDSILAHCLGVEGDYQLETQDQLSQAEIDAEMRREFEKDR